MPRKIEVDRKKDPGSQSRQKRRKIGGMPFGVGSNSEKQGSQKENQVREYPG